MQTTVFDFNILISYCFRLVRMRLGIQLDKYLDQLTVLWNHLNLRFPLPNHFTQPPTSPQHKIFKFFLNFTYQKKKYF